MIAEPAKVKHEYGIRVTRRKEEGESAHPTLSFYMYGKCGVLDFRAECTAAGRMGKPV